VWPPTSRVSIGTWIAVGGDLAFSRCSEPSDNGK
jgi:hypothetical protein